MVKTTHYFSIHLRSLCQLKCIDIEIVNNCVQLCSWAHFRGGNIMQNVACSVRYFRRYTILNADVSILVRNSPKTSFNIFYFHQKKTEIFETKHPFLRKFLNRSLRFTRNVFKISRFVYKILTFVNNSLHLFEDVFIKNGNL
jgi:hypothetical protein